MVSPEKMDPKKSIADFYEFFVDALTLYIQKDFVDEQEEIDFLIPYFGKARIIIHK